MIAFLGLLGQLAVTARAETRGACDPIEVHVTVRGPAGMAPRIELPGLAPFDLLRASPSPSISHDANHPGQEDVDEFTYVIVSEHGGSYVIPPFTARAGSLIARSAPLRVDVTGSRTPGVSGVVVRAQIDTGLAVGVRALAVPETVFVGQQANYAVAVLLSPSMRDQLKRNPTFFPPDVQSMLAYDLPAAGSSARRTINSACFEALAYQRAIFPLVAGRFAVPPAQLVYMLPVTGGFFSREESHEIETDSAVVFAIDPPTAGRPADFSGAVGSVRLTARLDTASARVGDPVVLTVRVSGVGNVKLFPRPTLRVPWATAIAADERVRVDTAAWRVAGSKEFDWVLTPKLPGDQEIAPIRYAYFDPDTRRYADAVSGPVHIHVTGGSLAGADTAAGQDVLPIRPRDAGAVLAPLNQRPGFWILLAVAPMPALGIVLRRKRRRRTPTSTPADGLRVLGREALDANAPDARVLRRAFADALGDRLGLTPEAFSRPGAVARVLRRAGASPEVAVEAEDFMRVLDAAAFSQDGALPAGAVERALQLYGEADREALRRGEFNLPTGLMAIGVLVSVAGVLAGVGDPTLGAFQQGIDAYGRRQYADAQSAFATAAVREPRSADAWANYGTASWAAGDSAHAVVGWQRGLRLDPAAPDLRERVELAHGLPLSGAGFVAPTSVNGVLLVIVACWVLAWLLVAVRNWRGVRSWTWSTRTLVIVAAGTSFVVRPLGSRLAGDALAVVRVSSPMNTDPAIGGEGAGSVLTAEVVRVVGQSGAWSLIALDDGRDGWIQSSDLIGLDQADPRAD